MSAVGSRKWIELNWLRRGNKQIPLPNLIYHSLPNRAGAYYPRQKDECCIAGRYYDLTDRGLIVVAENQADELGDFEEVLAHEWRHHLQRQRYKFAGTILDNSGDYKENIIAYFRDNWRELDAFLFAWDKIETRVTSIWFGWLREAKVINP